MADIPPCEQDERQYAIVTIAIAIPDGVFTSDEMWEYIWRTMSDAGMDVCPPSALDSDGQRIH